jgi:hypothetical protein
MRIVILDAGPLAIVTNPAASPLAVTCREWFEGLIRRGVLTAVPEIADYEVRRELLRADKLVGLSRLDALASHPAVLYLPLTTETMRLAARLWAEARARHRPAASHAALDADVILAAQAMLAGGEGDDVAVATTNVEHLADFVPAFPWESLR